MSTVLDQIDALDRPRAERLIPDLEDTLGDGHTARTIGRTLERAVRDAGEQAFRARRQGAGRLSGRLRDLGLEPLMQTAAGRHLALVAGQAHAAQRGLLADRDRAETATGIWDAWYSRRVPEHAWSLDGDVPPWDDFDAPYDPSSTRASVWTRLERHAEQLAATCRYLHVNTDFGYTPCGVDASPHFRVVLVDTWPAGSLAVGDTAPAGVTYRLRRIMTPEEIAAWREHLART